MPVAPLPPAHPHLRPKPLLQATLLIVAMAGIFVADTVLDLEIAIAMFYALVILTASHVWPRRAVLALAGLCAGLTLLSLALTPAGLWIAGLANTGLSLVTLIMTTWMVLKMATARAVAQAAQAHLLRLARARHLNGMATSLAHEINQPLAAIATSASACQRWLAPSPPNLDKARQTLARIVLDTERASHLIARVRSLARGEPPQPCAFALNPALAEVIALSQGDIARHGILLHTRLAPDLPDAWADRVQIQQVMANLLINALDALVAVPPSRRRLEISTALRPADPKSDPGPDTHVDPGHNAHTLLVRVRDSGAGIAPAQQVHMFEAFWTTKTHGMGVGLSLCRTIVEAHGGQINALSPPQGGAAFEFSVPVVRCPVVQRPVAAAA